MEHFETVFVALATVVNLYVVLGSYLWQKRCNEEIYRLLEGARKK